MQNKFRLLLRGLWLLICAGTWIGTVFYRPTLGSVMVTFGAFFLLTSGFVLLSRRPYFALSATTLTLLFLTLLSKAKEFFWKEKLFFTDFQVFFDPSNAETVLHYPLALGAFVVITLVLILIAAPRSRLSAHSSHSDCGFSDWRWALLRSYAHSATILVGDTSQGTKCANERRDVGAYPVRKSREHH